MKIFLKTDQFQIPVILKNSVLVDRIYEVLPFRITSSLWEKEIYLELPSKLDINIEEETLTTRVKKGTVAYWPGGNCLCVFFGSDPIEVNHEPFSSRKVVVLGEISDAVGLLDQIEAHQPVEVVKN